MSGMPSDGRRSMLLLMAATTRQCECLLLQVQTRTPLKMTVTTLSPSRQSPMTYPPSRVALSLGASAKNITSRWDGTALIAAAHLGHAEVVRTLIRAGAPLDHINNLGWTALIESIVLGDGGPRHTDTLRALVEAGANVNLADRNEQTPLSIARSRGYKEMVLILQRAGAH